MSWFSKLFRSAITHEYGIKTPLTNKITGFVANAAGYGPSGKIAATSTVQPWTGNNLPSSIQPQPVEPTQPTQQVSPWSRYAQGASQGAPLNNLPRTLGLNVQSYAAGGTVGPGGLPIRPGNTGVSFGGADPSMNMDMLSKDAMRAGSDPQFMEMVKQHFLQAMQSGELTAEELNKVVQLAKLAASNPALWPRLRVYAIQQGIGEEENIPEEFDPGLVYVILAVGQAMQNQSASTPGQEANVMPSMRSGGPVTGGGRNNGGVLAEVHEGEYVIPQDVVMYHGRKHLDGLVSKAREPSDG